VSYQFVLDNFGIAFIFMFLLLFAVVYEFCS